MIKIIFEVSEDFIRENSNTEVAVNKITSAKPDEFLKVFADSLVFRQMKTDIEEGKTEFIVNPNKLDEKSNELFDKFIGTACALAHFSVTDKVQTKEQ